MTAGPFVRSWCTTLARVLRYGPSHQEDRYGGLGEASLYDLGDEWSGFEITEAAFDRAWNTNGE